MEPSSSPGPPALSWNDIRVVGPALLAVFVLAVLFLPGASVGESGSVGNAGVHMPKCPPGGNSGNAGIVGPAQDCPDDPPPGPLPGEPGVSRIGAPAFHDPAHAAAEICRFLVDDGEATSIALARDDDFADALAGSALPVDCILFTAGGPDVGITPDTRFEIRRALGGDGTVYLLGGTNAVSTIVADVITRDGYTATRLEGPSRFETAEAVATTVSALRSTPPDHVIIARGDDWADAVTVGAYAHASTTPIVLTPRNSLHPAAARVVDAVVEAAPGSEALLIGGEGVVGPDVAAALPGTMRRIAGNNRMATAVAIAEQLWPAVPASGTTFVLANLEHRDAWTLALAAAPLASHLAGPQLGLRTDSYPTETEGYLTGQGFTDLPSVVLLGNLAFINSDVAAAVEASVTPQ